jgi:hypothetical protein
VSGVRVHARRVFLSSTSGGAVGGSAPRLYYKTNQIWSERSFCLSREDLFAMLESSLPHPSNCMRGHPGEHALMSMNASILVDSVGPPSAVVCRTATSFP